MLKRILTLIRCWVDPYKLVPADTGVIFDLCGMAKRNGNYDLQRACEQVVEYDAVEYWIEQYKSYQFALQVKAGLHSPRGGEETKSANEDPELERAIRLSKEDYQRETSNDQATAGPSGIKRTRSPTPETDPDDDLYSWPSSAKKSRKDDKTSSTSSSESSVTLKADSRSSKLSLNMEDTPSPAEVRRLRDKGFMTEFTISEQKKDNSEKSVGRPDVIAKAPSNSMADISPSNKSRGFLDTLVDFTRFSRNEDEHGSPTIEVADEILDLDKKRAPEYSGSGSLSGTDFPAENWTVAQDAELIRLRERTQPTPSWLQTNDILKRRFSDDIMFKRMNQSLPKIHYQRMTKEGAITGNVGVSVNGFRARKAALAFLDRKESDQVYVSKSKGCHRYTKEEDLEICRLKKYVMPNRSWSEIAKAFQKKFPVWSQIDRPDTALRGRYVLLRSKSGQYEGQSSVSDSEDSEAEEVREDWMGGNGSSTYSSSFSWSTAEDAELIRTRAKMEPRPSWQETVDALNDKFHKAASDTSRTYNSARQRWRWLKGENSQAKALREQALEMLGDADEASSGSTTSGFTTAEDNELVKLRDQEMSDASWAELAEMFNARLYLRPDYRQRSGSSLYGRYQQLRSRWKAIAEKAWSSLMDFVLANPQGVTPVAVKWTAEEHDALVLLRSNMPDQSWEEITTAFNAHGMTKGWSERTAKYLVHRLRGMDEESLPEPTDKSSNSWTSAQDNALLQLRDVMPDKSWSEFANAFLEPCEKENWPIRNADNIRHRYKNLRPRRDDQQ